MKILNTPFFYLMIRSFVTYAKPKVTPQNNSKIHQQKPQKPNIHKIHETPDYNKSINNYNVTDDKVEFNEPLCVTFGERLKPLQAAFHEPQFTIYHY